MPKYYVNKNAQNNGDHEVHIKSCHRLPKPKNREYLGEFSNCQPAVDKAKSKGYSKVNGCYYCCPKCNTD